MFEKELDVLRESGLLRTIRAVESASGPHCEMDGRKIVALCSNDYLGLAAHPALSEAARVAMERYGFGSGASRLVSGTSMLHEELERRIARFKGADAALLFNSGYAANTGIIPALAKEGDALFSDRLNHASIIDGCRMSKATTVVYRHRDMNHLEERLKAAGSARRRLIVTDGVFSMDGDIAPLRDLVFLSEKYAVILIVDDAHGCGVLGKRGRGTGEHFGVEDKIHVSMGTLGKAFGSFGAYVAGDRDLVSYLLNTARSFMFSTALPPAICAASIAAMDVFEAEPWRREHLWQNRNRLAAGLTSMGIGTGDSETPILPVVLGSADSAVKASVRLLDEGILAPAIRPPTVPADAARIRATVMATHSNEDIDSVLAVFHTLKSEGLFIDRSN